jgi:putative transcriptional regulator
MKTVRMKLDVQNPAAKLIGGMDAKRLDATTESDIAMHQAEDEANAMNDAAKFARRVRRRLGFSQAEFAQRIDVSLDTIRNWEQGKRCPTGAAKALLKVLDKAPEAALTALH